MEMGRSLFQYVCVFAIIIASALAQTTTPAPSFTGEIRGTVKSGNTPLPGVSITASNTLTGKKRYTSTDPQGHYQLQVTSRGRYVIKAEFPAFAIVTKEAVINPQTTNATVDAELI